MDSYSFSQLVNSFIQIIGHPALVTISTLSFFIITLLSQLINNNRSVVFKFQINFFNIIRIGYRFVWALDESPRNSIQEIRHSEWEIENITRDSNTLSSSSWRLVETVEH